MTLNVAPWVSVILDSILVFTVCQQLFFRVKIHRKYAHLEVVKEEVCQKRKDIYRICIALILFTKFFQSVSWLLYQGWDTWNLQSHIKRWHFWMYYGIILSISFLVKGDFAAVVVGIERNIHKNGYHKKMWRALLMGSATLSVILCMWGVALSIGIPYIPIWQSLGFPIAILNGFITCYVYIVYIIYKYQYIYIYSH